MYLNVGEDISDTMMVGGVPTPINKDESVSKGTNHLIYGKCNRYIYEISTNVCILM